MKYKLPPDSDLILNSAVRYALGRKSYIVSSICSYIVANYDTLTERCKEVLIADINDAIKGNVLGRECDKVEWLSLKRFIEKQKGLDNANSNTEI